jgi:hypothetical protein
MFRRLFEILSLFASLSAFAGTVLEILDSRHVFIQVGGEDPRPTPDFWILQDVDDGETLGYARVVGEAFAAGTWGLKAVVKVHRESPLVRIGSRARPLDLKKGVLPEARQDLFMSDIELPAYLRPPVYLGYAVGSTAALLQPGEWLLGLGPAMYGFNDKVQVDTLTLYDLLGLPNLAAKYEFVDDDEFRIAASVRGFYSQHDDALFGDLDLYMDSFTNSRWVTYTRLSLQSRRPTNSPLFPQTLENGLTAELAIHYGYLLSDWNHLVLGPIFNLDAKTIGGTMSYLIVAKTFHLLLGLQSQNFLEASFSQSGYSVVVDFWWRF